MNGETMRKHPYTNDEIAFLAELYQEIADSRRIRHVNKLDRRRYIVESITRALVVIAAFAVIFAIVVMFR